MADRDLDTPLDEILDQRRGGPEGFAENRWLLDAAVQSVAKAEGLDYVQAHERLMDAAQSVRDQIGGPKTLRAAVAWATTDPAHAEMTVRLLDASGAALDAATRKATKKLRAEKLDAHGRVLADGTVRLDADGSPMSRKVREKRLEKARALDARYQGDEGRRLFESDDTAHFSAGVDLLRILSRPIREAKAQARVDGVARVLDRLIDEAGADRQRLLDAESKVAQIADRHSAAALRDALVAQRDEAPEVLRMLEQPKAAGRRLLDQQKPKKKGDGKQAGGMEARVRERMRRLDMPERDFVIALEQEVAGEKMPPLPAEPDRHERTRGLAPDSVQLDQRIRAHLAANDLPDSEYVKVLDQYLNGGLGL
jgi:hypothetical protein